MLALADHRADQLLLPCHPAGIPFFGRVLGTWFNFTETGKANGLITGQVLLAFGEIDVQIAPVVIVFHLVNRLDIHAAEDSNGGTGVRIGVPDREAGYRRRAN